MQSGWLLLLAGTWTVPYAAGQGGPIWADEFDGSTVNPANWEFMIGTGTDYGLPEGWGNNELQYYTDRPENAFVSGGYLHIVARREDYAGSEYTSARLRTRNLHEFLYGRLEARIRQPATQGIWTAFWMLPTNSPYGGWAASGEIDIIESINNATTAYGTIHFGGNWPNNVYSGGTLSDGTDFSDDFHVYTIDWEPDVIRWYVDGVVYHSESSADWYSTAAPGNDRAPFDTPFHLLLNCAVGGNFPGWPDASSTFPQEMLVDWVRVYPYSAAQSPFFGAPHAIPGTIEAEDFDLGPEGVAYHDCDSTNQGGAYRPAGGVDIEASTEGAFNVGWMCAGEWIEYTVNVAAAGAYLMHARVAANSAGGTFRVLFDGIDKTGQITAPGTGGWQNWITVSRVVELDAGEQVMLFLNTSSGEFNINRYTFTALAPEDIDRSGTVDLVDFGLLVGCLAGPDVIAPPGGCTQTLFERCDLDGESDVDLQDAASFLRAGMTPE